MSRQRSVAQQNAATREAILDAARLFRSASPWLRWLAPCLQGRGLSPEAGVLVQWASCPDQDGNDYWATWLTDEGRFWEIRALLPHDGSAVQVDAFDDVTGTMETSAHQRGTGKSFGCLALEVLGELRQRTPAS